MQLIGTMIVRDEADILQETLPAAAAQLDRLLVVDCGSVDDSPAIIRNAMRHNGRITLAATLGALAPEQVRTHLWRFYRRQFSGQDWWIVIDADEFFADEPRPVLNRAVAAGADYVVSRHANFYYTAQEYRAWQAGHETLADRQRPISKRRQSYRMHTSMVRAYRNHPWLRWNHEGYLPGPFTACSPERLTYRHYQWRDPVQIEHRLRLRVAASLSPALRAANPHWDLVDIDQAVSPDDDSTLRTWREGEPLVEDPALPAPPRTSKWKSVAKRLRALLHGLSVRQQPSAYPFAPLS